MWRVLLEIKGYNISRVHKYHSADVGLSVNVENCVMIRVGVSNICLRKCYFDIV